MIKTYLIGGTGKPSEIEALAICSALTASGGADCVLKAIAYNLLLVRPDEHWTLYIGYSNNPCLVIHDMIYEDIPNLKWGVLE